MTKEQIVSEARTFANGQAWNQDLNADFIIRRVIAIAKATGVSLNKDFVSTLYDEAHLAGVGLYGNASQMKQNVEAKAKEATPKASAMTSEQIMAKFGIAM
jgi:hypothetical protein